MANPSPALGSDAFQLCAVPQLSGQTATDSRYQLELLEPHSLGHLSSAAVFYTCELASLPGYCWLLLFSAEAMLGHNVSPRAVTKGCSRRHSCFVAARLCLTVEASGRSMFTLLNSRLRCSSQAGNACNGYRTSNSCRRWSTAVSPRRSALCQSARTQYQPV